MAFITINAIVSEDLLSEAAVVYKGGGWDIRDVAKQENYSQTFLRNFKISKISQIIPEKFNENFTTNFFCNNFSDMTLRKYFDIFAKLFVTLWMSGIFSW